MFLRIAVSEPATFTAFIRPGPPLPSPTRSADHPHRKDFIPQSSERRLRAQNRFDFQAVKHEAGDHHQGKRGLQRTLQQAGAERAKLGLVDRFSAAVRLFGYFDIIKLILTS
jgi:hypothetical protein